MQKSRFEDQRCDFKTITNETGNPNTLRGHRMYLMSYILLFKYKKQIMRTEIIL
jgi:hypothetical protein